MNTLLAESDFRGDINIPNTERSEVCEEVKRFIETHEPVFIDEVLGVALASEFYTQAAANPVLAPWDLLMNGGTWVDTRTGESITRRLKGLKYCAARYVYFRYMRNLATLTTGSGEVKPKTENAKGVSGVDKSVNAWNEMSRELDQIWYMLRYCMDGTTPKFSTYNYRLPCFYNFRRINAFGI